MTKKDYLIPSVEVIEMGYRDPVCQAMSGETNTLEDYELLDLDITWDSII